MKDNTELRLWPTPVRLVAFDLLGNLKIDRVFANGAEAYAESIKFIGGTFTFFDVNNDKQLWYEVRA